MLSVIVMTTPNHHLSFTANQKYPKVKPSLAHRTGASGGRLHSTLIGSLAGRGFSTTNQESVQLFSGWGFWLAFWCKVVDGVPFKSILLICSSPANWNEDYDFRLLLSGPNPVLYIVWPLVLSKDNMYKNWMRKNMQKKWEKMVTATGRKKGNKDWDREIKMEKKDTGDGKTRDQNKRTLIKTD